MSNQSRDPRRTTGVKLPAWALLLILAAGLLLLTLSSLWLFRTIRGLASIPDSAGEFNPTTGQLSPGQTAPQVQMGTSVASGGQIAPISLPTWSGTERVNILLLGVDLRCEEEGPTHSDTIIVATIDRDPGN